MIFRRTVRSKQMSLARLTTALTSWVHRRLCQSNQTRFNPIDLCVRVSLLPTFMREYKLEWRGPSGLKWHNGLGVGLAIGTSRTELLFRECRFRPYDCVRHHRLRGVDSVSLQMLLTGTCRQCGSWSVAGHNDRKAIGRNPICAC